MPEIGQTISRYRIVEKIGQGGMGEVYLADDTTLDRKVALKFLPDAFTSDPERMARFEREAKLLASLNHPNIAGIYGLEQADGSRFLVLEYVEGETLQARLSKGALPLEESLELCRQIAEGLEAAHEKGVIHRDLKPANVMITAEEKVKILDFGLAKAFADDTQSIDSSQSPTLTEAMTQPGVILGTAAYMSPEQAKGKSVDKRADIWAFGCILYECLTGKRAFEGETVTETLAAILRGEPDWNRLPPNIHPRISLLLERCLEKHSKDRYGSISDARVDIQKVLTDPSGVFAQRSLPTRPKKKLRVSIPWVAAIVILCLIIAGISGWLLKPSPPPEIISFDYDLPEGLQFSRALGGGISSGLAISPDGSKFVYCTPEGLYLRSMEELHARLLNGTEGNPQLAFFSPNGRWIGYWASTENKLKKIAVSGGAPIDICDVGIWVAGASWNSDDTIVYSDVMGGGIKRVSADGGTPDVLIEVNIKGVTTAEGLPSFPQILPDGKTLLFTNVMGLNNAEYEIMTYSLESEKRTLLFKGGTAARYLPTGHIAYTLTTNNATNIYAVPFDLDSLKTTGGHVSLVDGVIGRNFDFSSTGTLVYLPATSAGARTLNTLVWVDRNGKEEPLSAPPDAYLLPRISPDGKKVAFSINKDGNEDIYVWDIVRGTMMRLTRDEAGDGSPIWTSDSKRIAFSSEREGGLGGVFLISADGTGDVEKLGSIPDIGLMPYALSADGKTLVVVELNLGDSSAIGFNIGTLSLEGDHEYKTLLVKDYSEAAPKISPDGQWMAYWASELDQAGEIYVCPFPDVDKSKEKVSQGEGSAPLWSSDGRELFYFGTNGIMAVPVEYEPTFNTLNQKVLFKSEQYIQPSLMSGTPWDIHPDGRFLMMKPTASAGESAAEPTPSKIIVVTNWFEKAKEQVSAP